MVMAAMPVAIRVSKCSRKTNQARRAVSTPSRFNRRETCEAAAPDSPSMRSPGPITPPATIAARSHGASALRIGASVAFLPVTIERARRHPRPSPDPR